MKKIMEEVRILINKHPFLRRFLYPAILIRRFFMQKKFSYQEEICNNLRKILVEDPVIKVDEFQGIFTLDRRSHLFKRLVMTNQYEPELVSIVLRYINKKRDALDVGANIGFYTVLLAKNIDGKVLAIEPTTNALKYLYKNIKLNQVQEKVIIFEGGACNYTGIAEIKTIEGKEEYSSFGAMIHPAISKEKYLVQKVNVETIDNLVKRYSLDPGFIKVDVEGMEHLVFDGAKNVLETNRPVILSELSNPLLKAIGSSSKDVINFIMSYEYDVINPIRPSIPAYKEDFANILCIPKEIKEKV